jgi:hypothetical protein
MGCGDSRRRRNQASSRMQSQMAKTFYELLGFNNASRILDGDVFAREVYVPNVGYSHAPYYNMWNLVSIRNHVEKRHGAPSPLSQNRRNILVMLRDKGRRLDTKQFSASFFEQMELLLPNDTIIKYAASNATLMTCLTCQMKVFQEADVIIGSHGAGLSHLMWAKEGATVLEVLPSPGDSSIYAELPFMFGQKYFPMSDQAQAKDFVHLIQFANADAGMNR